MWHAKKTIQSGWLQDGTWTMSATNVTQPQTEGSSGFFSSHVNSHATSFMDLTGGKVYRFQLRNERVINAQEFHT